MAKYYSLMLSPNISVTVHGYLICENVPICRSGFQEYKGSELVGFSGYEESWGLEPEERYKVFRPKESVLDPEFIKSIEGNTVVDEHPDGSVVHVDNDGELNCGHIEKVGKGEDLPDGEVTLKGDLHIKDPTLIQKIRPEEDPDSPYAVRDVSLGYGLKIKRLDDGTLVMYHLRGNHVAVVEKGRAGNLIAIRDSAIPEVVIKEPVVPEIKVVKESKMSKETIFGRMLKALALDASPEEMAEAAKAIHQPEAKEHEEGHTEESHSGEIAALKEYCNKGGDKAALLAFLKGEHKPAADAGNETLEELQEETHEETPGKTEGEEHQNEGTAAEEKGDEMATDFADIKEKGDSVLKQANDSVRTFINTTKPAVALIIAKPKANRTALEQTMVDSYNSTVKSLNVAGGRAYRTLHKVRSEAVAIDSQATKVEETCTCFDGVNYRAGLKKHEAHLAQKGTK